ncbi:hypothetical protein [Mycobacterium aquaticum]|nr:hypothetical protein [Mycobacterium aquaticum]
MRTPVILVAGQADSGCATQTLMGFGTTTARARSRNAAHIIR